ncbi:hypothetical protein SAMN04488502_1011137 [Dendrosporobacter quercicolus]|uniref:Uncharacterized protein n=1 Tax=Dendrosporobacter quercicolus TaxID=146817 RepID=A0A1G9NVK7_9FIRM|nr:hypothetical protein SAMN04488502_1011137 [Dendrosporobacter quercicolus]
MRDIYWGTALTTEGTEYAEGYGGTVFNRKVLEGREGFLNWGFCLKFRCNDLHRSVPSVTSVYSVVPYTGLRETVRTAKYAKYAKGTRGIILGNGFEPQRARSTRRVYGSGGFCLKFRCNDLPRSVPSATSVYSVVPYTGLREVYG